MDALPQTDCEKAQTRRAVVHGHELSHAVKTPPQLHKKAQTRRAVVHGHDFSHAVSTPPK
jgi:hypothetical protein